MLATNLMAWQVVVPLLGAPVSALLSCRRMAWGLSVLLTLFAFISALVLFAAVDNDGLTYAMGNWPVPVGIVYHLDRLNAAMLVLVTGIATVSMLYARRSVAAEIAEEKIPLFYATYLLCLAGLLGITITNDAFNVYVFLEISSLATYTLIAMGRDRRALLASFEYLVLGTIGATFYLIAIGLLYIMTGTLNIADLAVRLEGLRETPPVIAAFAFMTTGLALKIAIFPLHLWLTNAYTNAPSFVSSFLSATATKVGIYVLLRMLFSVFGVDFSFHAVPFTDMLVAFSAIAVVVGSLVAVYQQNVKRLLAYSSVAQIGYITLGIGMASKLGIIAAVVHMFNHALAKGALFMVVGNVLLMRGGVRVKDFTGLGRSMPWTMAAFVVAGLSLIGVPLTAGFVSKWYLVLAALEQQNWLVVALVLAGSLLAAVYIWKIVEVAYFQPAPEGAAGEAPLSMRIALWALALLSVFAGINTEYTVGVALRIASSLGAW